MLNKVLDIQTTPSIVNLPAPIKMIGISIQTGMKTIYSDAVTLGKRYEIIKNQKVIPNQSTPWGFVAISKDFTPDGKWVYLMGAVVTTLDQIPDGLIGYEIPSRTYACFKVRPRFSFLWGITLGLTKKFIFTEWLPSSDYEANPDPIGDFEYHDARSLSSHPEIDLMVAVRNRSGEPTQ